MKPYFYTSHGLQLASGYCDERQFLQDCRRYDLPIIAGGRVMGHNRYRLTDLCLALVIAELQEYEIPLSICARLLNRLNLDHLRDRLDELEVDQIEDLIIMIAARYDLDIEDFPTVATDWDQVVTFARDQNLNFFTVPVGEAVKEKLAAEWYHASQISYLR